MFVEQTALVNRVASAVATEPQELLNSGSADDQGIYLGELAQREAAQTFVCRTVAGPEEVPYLLQAEADALCRIDDRQAPQNTRAVATLARDALRRVDQAAALVVAQPRDAHAGPLSNFSNRESPVDIRHCGAPA